jgi:hypothetical protein
MFPEWPDWRFLPMQDAYATLSGGGDRRVPLDRVHHVCIVTALAAWWGTQRVNIGLAGEPARTGSANFPLESRAKPLRF